jgi:hypothetical protein
MRRLIVESMGFQGVYEATKDYLQPVLQAAAISAAMHWSQTRTMSQIQQTTLLIGPLYLVLHLLAGTASRQAHRVVAAVGEEDRAARFLWVVYGLLFVGLAVAAFWRIEVAVIIAFIALDTLHNIWRPVQLDRFDAHGSEDQGATLLSIESQARRLTTVIAAPLLGLAVDAVHVSGIGGPFWPVGLLGAFVAILAVSRPNTDSRRP